MSDIRDLANRARRKARALRAAADDAETAQALVDAAAAAIKHIYPRKVDPAVWTSRRIKRDDARDKLRALLGSEAPAARVPAGRVLGSLASVLEISPNPEPPCPACGESSDLYACDKCESLMCEDCLQDGFCDACASLESL